MRVRMLVVAMIATPIFATVSYAQGQSKSDHSDNRVKVCEKAPAMNGKSGKVRHQPRKCVPDVPPPPPATGGGIAQIMGMAFNDLDGDGSYDNQDTPLAGVVVTLSGTVSESATTAADGTYSFVGLPVGSYTVCVSSGGRAVSQPSSGPACPGGSFGWSADVPDFLPSVWYMDQDFGLR